MLAELTIDTPEWAVPLLAPSRYKGIYGGRGSGKSHERAEAMIDRHIEDKNLASVCLREVQKSIKMSVKRLLAQKIQAMGVTPYFEVQDQQILRRGGDGIIIFQGMQNHTADSIKSLEGFDIAWFEEAQNASQTSLDLLRPTIRKPGSELWFTWNPSEPTDPVELLLRGDELPPDSIVIEVNFEQNPWFPEVLRKEMEYDRKRDTDKYAHVWKGKYKKYSKARVFNNWRIEEFETPPDAIFRLGADWGFSTDPTVLVRCFIIGRELFVDYEAYEIGCEIPDTPDLFLTVPNAEKWPITADSARPETISYMRKHGFPKIHAAIKGTNSNEEGVEWLKSYDIVVHPRCVHMQDELMNYKYKVDTHTEKVLPILADKDNNVIDALRYACETLRRALNNKPKEEEEFTPIPVANAWNKR